MDPSIDEADRLRASALEGLTQQERDQVLNDVHGVIKTQYDKGQSTQNNEFVAAKLSELDAEIAEIPTKAAYLRAKMTNPGYVLNRTFRLQFLMADSFEPKVAAQRLVAWFETKLVLFGSEKLTKDLTLSDLTPEEIQCLELGVVQRLAGTDHSGRSVVSCWPTTTREPSITTEHKLKAFWYLINTIGWGSTNESDNMDAQQKGLVTVVFGKGPPAQADRVTLWKILNLFRSVPTRVASIHYCYDDIESANSLVNLAIKALDPKSRARFRTHYGKFSSYYRNVGNITIIKSSIELPQLKTAHLLHSNKI